MIRLYNIGLFLITVMVVSCSKPTKKVIGKSADYDTYLSFSDTTSFNRAKRDLSFWEVKLATNPNQYMYLGQLANANEVLFKTNGKIEHLKNAENYYKKSLLDGDPNQIGILHALCRNYISQHKFKECLPLLERADSIGLKKLNTHQILFDVYLELGNTSKAKAYLEAIKNPNDFNYLIRKAKWEDHEGNLDQAISFLELATKLAEKNNNNTLKIWSFSNLGDFYGHQGNIQKSYNQYLKTLSLDPNNSYVLKKIAWIQYAHNKNFDEANRILDSILKFKQTPDLYLLKSEIAAYSKDTIFNKIYENKFLELTSKAVYGDMYNTYIIDLHASNKKNIPKAIDLANREINNRPTPLSYDLLAWSYLQAGKKEDALNITTKYVSNTTFEPTALYHTAKIYKANNYKPQGVKILKKELLEASFELGPLTTLEVNKL